MQVFAISQQATPRVARAQVPVLCLLTCAVTLGESIQTTTGVNELLLAGVERVALVAQFDADGATHRLGFEGVAT